MTPEEVQKLLGINDRQLRYMREQRRLPFHRITPRAIRFKRSEVEAYLAERRVGAK